MRTRAVTDHHLPANLEQTREEERHRMTLDALADVDAKRTVEHAKIDAWASRLHKTEDGRRPGRRTRRVRASG
jgi:hypothetical protein